MTAQTYTVAYINDALIACAADGDTATLNAEIAEFDLTVDSDGVILDHGVALFDTEDDAVAAGYTDIRFTATGTAGDLPGSATVAARRPA